ncbi:Coenzyme F420:L-glutamate ligase [Sterolibacterium denitrificans]|uniref:Coenzyme F420:L-glutamate ligase n=2 Tax=Sterolibacterium denitrificans TaxID=157592 RepID=A0A7Z7HRK9_9PROT|nr:coenzyme F420-0:L-glutamate ligase [Sterolibacterium denitrificans]KYC28965.1 F420-0--gamma-glutamyl ligase [Sterolibacterium denitrificans]SMB23074.1 Coenzyme F420:L-glutamate ligase [Sterolibacterium denitrificans]
MAQGITYTALQGIKHIQPGDDLAAIVQDGLRRNALQARDGDVLVLAQKIVSKAEGRSVDLSSVQPSPHALELAQIVKKDARLVELVLSESTDILRAIPNVLIVRHRCGYVMANAGIDHSNVDGGVGDRVLLLPVDADASAAVLREQLNAALGCEIGIVISDSFGRPWRNGVVNVALGSAGLPALIDRRGERDMYGRTLEVTQVAYADAIAAAAGLAMGEGAEGTPLVLVQGLAWQAPERNAQSLIRPLDEDLFK